MGQKNKKYMTPDEIYMAKHSSKEWDRIIAAVDLPEWVHSFAHLARPTATIKYVPKDNHFSVTRSDNGSVTFFESFEKAYDSIGRNVDAILHKNITKGVEGDWLGFHAFSIKGTGDREGRNRLFISSGDEDTNKWLVSLAYYKWLDFIVPNYDTNPNDWLTAYHFIDLHPAFWTRHSRGGDSGYTPPAYEWDTESGIDKIDMWVTQTSSGNNRIVLETGGHVPSLMGNDDLDYSTRYADWTLTTSAPTFEKAVVKLAKKIREAFELNGDDNRDFSKILDEPKTAVETADKNSKKASEKKAAVKKTSKNRKKK